MAKKVSVSLVDDLDGAAEAAETIPFGLDGVTYEIDLSKKNAAVMRKDFAKWVDKARRTGRVRRVIRKPHAGINLADVRVWAEANGYSVAPRGRVATAIMDAYRQAENTSPAFSHK